MKKSEFKRLLEMSKSNYAPDVILAFEIAQQDPIVFRWLRMECLSYENFITVDYWSTALGLSKHICKSGALHLFDMDKYLEDD